MPSDSTALEFGVVPLEQARQIDGLTLFQEMLAGRLPSAPIMKVLGARLGEVERGRVAFTYTPVLDHYNPLGTVHGGIAATLLDSVMGCAVHTTLPAGTGYTTVEIKVNYVRAMTDTTGPVKAEGRIINVGKRIATAEGRLHDAGGRLLAHGSTTCLIFPI
ncbi:MAG: PaaI family thioesterase [Reyranellaceae bacterium]